MKKKIPYSVADFREITSGDYYYVDKTRYLEELEYWKAVMFLRPKRFGKSLWCSTLAYYYDVNYRDEFDSLFGTTYIGKHPTREHNSYAVMFFSFAAINTSGDLEKIQRNFDSCCHFTYLEFLRCYPALQLQEEQLPEDATTALKMIFEAAAKHGLPPLYIIIDEYDNFTNSLLISHGMDDYHAVTTGDSFLRTFYKAIKDAVGRGKVGRVFLTGVLPVTLDDMTSGFNIAANVSWENRLLGMVGFTQGEVETLVRRIFSEWRLPRALKPLVLEDLKANYDGYVLKPGCTPGIYNSTICNFYLHSLCMNGTLPERKVDPNLALDRNWLRLMARSEAKPAERIMSILNDGSVPFSAITLDKRLNAMSLDDPEALLLLFFHLGLLTWNDDESLRVPNQNQLFLLGQYANELQGWHLPDAIMVGALKDFMATHDIRTLFATFWDKYIGLIPAAAFTHLCENFYRTSFFILCKPNMPRRMDVDIEQNTRSGRYDMRFWGHELPWWESHSVLLEFKYRPAGTALPEEPPAEDVAQISAYAADQRLLHPEKEQVMYLVYVRGHENWRIHQVK